MTKMIASGIWGGQPFSDDGFGKRFKPEFESFISEK